MHNKKKFKLYYTLYIKINSKKIKRNARSKLIKYLESHIGDYLYECMIGKYFIEE
jgi:hypothetical protein